MTSCQDADVEKFSVKMKLSSLTVFILSLAIIKGIIKLLIGWDRSATCLLGKTTIVTGANSGIGFYTALDFAKRGARVILACRDRERAEKARNKIVGSSGNDNVDVRLLDFSSLYSVREFAELINGTESRLDILVNNAACAGHGDEVTCDGLNLTMQVNHLGPFLLTNLLLDLLRRSAPSRIINVTCNAAHLAQLDPNNINAYPKDSKLAKAINYGNSKLCNILFTNELSRRLKDTGVTVNSLNPGMVDTNIYRRLTPFSQVFMRPLAFTVFKTSEEGAQTSIYVATSKEIDGVTGEYFDNCCQAWLPPMPSIARDEIVARKVWDKSSDLVSIKRSSQHRNCGCQLKKRFEFGSTFKSSSNSAIYHVAASVDSVKVLSSSSEESVEIIFRGYSRKN